LRVTTKADLGGLGASAGPAVAYVLMPGGLEAAWLPWGLLLVMMLAPFNRRGQAWFIFLPLLGIQLLCAAAKMVAEGPMDAMVGMYGLMVRGLAFGLAALWLLAPWVAAGRWWRAFAGTFFVLAVSGAVVFLGERNAMEQWLPEEITGQLILALAVLGLVTAVGFRLCGRMCRAPFRVGRASLWMFLSLLVSWAGGMVAFVFAVGPFISGFCGPDWDELMIGVAGITTLSYAVLLPFLVLSAWKELLRERLWMLLGVPFASVGVEVSPQKPIEPSAA
jgi:hypothetical protein